MSVDVSASSIPLHSRRAWAFAPRRRNTRCFHTTSARPCLLASLSHPLHPCPCCSCRSTAETCSHTLLARQGCLADKLLSLNIPGPPPALPRDRRSSCKWGLRPARTSRLWDRGGSHRSSRWPTRSRYTGVMASSITLCALLLCLEHAYFTRMRTQTRT